MAGDEVVISKAGDKTYGRGRFYSSLAQRPINSVSFMAVSLIDVQARCSYPLQVEQRQPPAPTEEPVEPSPKRKRGRPKGSQNHVKPAPELTPDLTLLQGMITAITARIAPLTGSAYVDTLTLLTPLHLTGATIPTLFYQTIYNVQVTADGTPQPLPRKLCNGPYGE